MYAQNSFYIICKKNLTKYRYTKKLNLLSLQLKTYTDLIKRKVNIPFAEPFYREDQ